MSIQAHASEIHKNCACVKRFFRKRLASLHAWLEGTLSYVGSRCLWYKLKIHQVAIYKRVWLYTLMFTIGHSN